MWVRLRGTPPGPGQQSRWYVPTAQFFDFSACAEALLALSMAPQSHVMAQAHARIMTRALQAGDTLGRGFGVSDSTLLDLFPNLAYWNESQRNLGFL